MAGNGGIIGPTNVTSFGKNTVTMFGSKYAIISSQFKNLREESIRNKLSKKMNHIFL